jgi:diketogulonate reductase-like aldo/keto reductase
MPAIGFGVFQTPPAETVGAVETAIREGYRLHAFDRSARKLGVEQIDLLLLHQPLPSAFRRHHVLRRRGDRTFDDPTLQREIPEA